jgi:hypothetical protein
MKSSFVRSIIPELQFGYHLGAVLLGFLTHPYKTVQDVVRQRIPGTIIFFPLLIWIAGVVLLRASELILYKILPFLGFWWFLFVWYTVFLLFWQILLLYLFVRFSKSISE